MKKAFALIAAFLIMLLPCMSVNAYPSSGSITVVMINKADKQPLYNTAATVIRIADCSYAGSDVSFSLNSDFYDTGVDLDDSDSAQTLYSSAKSKGIDGLTVTSDAEGKAVFADCELGAYLVFSEDDIFTPFIVFIPMVTDDGLSFDITAEPKIDIPEEPVTDPDPDDTTSTTTLPPVTDTPTDTSSSTTSSTEKLPQTGMLQYPIPILGLCGVLMFSKGFVMYVNGKKEDN